jgi:hypothetical protein
MINALMGKPSYFRLFGSKLEVLGKRSFPHQLSFTVPIFL